MAYTNFVRLKDHTAANPLWNGEEVYLLGTKFNIAGGNTVVSKPKTFQDINLTTADIAAGDTGSDYSNNWNRRKANVSYSGFENQKIPITCIYNPVEVGSTTNIQGSPVKIFSPNKLYELILKPRTVYLKDEFLIDLLISAEDDSPAIYSSKGIPVMLNSWSIVPSVEGKEVIMDLAFEEDKEV